MWSGLWTRPQSVNTQNLKGCFCLQFWLLVDMLGAKWKSLRTDGQEEELVWIPRGGAMRGSGGGGRCPH